MRSFIQKITAKILDALFPVRCPFCDKIVAADDVHVAGHEGSYKYNNSNNNNNNNNNNNKTGHPAEIMQRRLVCPDCLKALHYVKDPFCMKCGKQMLDDTQEYCADCRKREHLFVQGRSLLQYDDAVRYAIYRFKYGRRKEYARAFAALTAAQMESYIKMVSPDYFIPVPLHKKRFAKRGYNQAQLYAKHLGRIFSLPCRDDIVIRSKNTRPQKELDVQKRQNNLKKAFKIVRNDVELKTIILIDDIYTTGSTMDALSRELLAAGAAKVYFLTIAGGSQ